MSAEKIWNVQDFGAIPDGRDCTAAVQAVVDEMKVTMVSECGSRG